MKETTTNVSQIEKQEDRLVVSGDLNFSTVPRLWQDSLVLLAASPKWNFDLAKINFSNSAGLALLIEWVKYAKKMQKEIYFHHIPAQFRSIIDATSMNECVSLISNNPNLTC